MSELHQPTTRPVAPAQAPGTSAPSTDGANEVYRRAVEARPTGFSENPIGAVAHAVDRIGKAASGVFASRAMEGQDGLQAGESRLKHAIATMRQNPGSLNAKQAAFAAGMQLMSQMQQLAPNDPRRLAVARFLIGLATQLGPQNIPFHSLRQDVYGLLRQSAQILSQFGSPQDMQSAFSVEALLKAALPESSPQAVAVRDELMQRFGLSQNAKAMLANGWAVRIARSGEVPQLDLTGRTLVLDAAQSNPSLGVLARAYWQDQTMRAPEARDGFVEAFRKVAGHSVLSRKYREVRDHARRELQHSRIGVLGASSDAPTAAGTASVDDSADMFASLAAFSRGSDVDAQQLPGELQQQLSRFYAPV